MLARKTRRWPVSSWRDSDDDSFLVYSEEILANRFGGSPLDYQEGTLAREIGDALLKSERRMRPGTIGTPGGHVEVEDFTPEPGLTTQFVMMLERAALRELVEETGLTASGAVLVFAAVDDDGNYCVMMRARGFLDDCMVDADDPALMLVAEPGTEALWLPVDEVIVRSAWPQFYGAARVAGAF